MTELEKFKKFRDTTLAQIMHEDAVKRGEKKKTDNPPLGHYVLTNETCEELIKGKPFLDKKDLLKIKGIGNVKYALFGDALHDYFTRSNCF
jgi:hypothetical protein